MGGFPALKPIDEWNSTEGKYRASNLGYTKNRKVRISTIFINQELIK